MPFWVFTADSYFIRLVLGLLLPPLVGEGEMLKCSSGTGRRALTSVCNKDGDLDSAVRMVIVV